MQPVITVIHVLSAIGLIGLVLLQQGKGADAGAAFGSGSAGTVFGARGPASFLTRTTAVLAAVFFATSLTLAYMSSQRVERRSVVESVAPPAPTGGEASGPAGVPAADTPADVPAVLDTGEGDGAPPDTPPASSGSGGETPRGSQGN